MCSNGAIWESPLWVLKRRLKYALGRESDNLHGYLTTHWENKILNLLFGSFGFSMHGRSINIEWEISYI